jgi:hypothetical protein
MEVITIGDKKFEVIRELPRTNYKDKKGFNVPVKNYEILCGNCKQPKSISRPNLIKGRGLVHLNCLNPDTRFSTNKLEIKNSIAFSVLCRCKSIINNRRTMRLECTLTLRDILDIIFNKCTYCGTKPSRYLRQYKIPYNGIDRIDSNIGYTKSNCVSCCSECNLAKRTMSVKQFMNWLDRIARFNGYTKGEEDESTNKNS